MHSNRVDEERSKKRNSFRSRIVTEENYNFFFRIDFKLLVRPPYHQLRGLDLLLTMLTESHVTENYVYLLIRSISIIKR